MLMIFLLLVGTFSGTKRKQSSSLKQAKQQAKRQREGTNSTVICKSCQQSKWSQYNEVLARNLGFPYIAFTRKLLLDSIDKSDYKEILKNKIIVSSRDIHNILLFVKSHDSIPYAIYTQQYWHSVCQLINGKKITNSASTPSNLISYWDAFKDTNPNAVGASQCLTEACKELETCYNNHIVENFEQQLLYFLNTNCRIYSW
ncbi:uncharacterized protein RHIMIDRAFT_264747 [Rhizopus microsporus ATCC 52813]|uniref:Uncharacterized protein n=1 Tax=Rhizopus microsporus ATCC 52813 TaxID=1340429 RepID=A0A2G4T4Q3_RHIZD|nr:uncharacterized protein RHIMIDRAFT_264747 [Rhizopus microsporus ATCC 52813]PHZ15995.1 hypothetical protein RHIMIDRAFT_264747 [Rhizopus microsporus ATCC 52813]